MHHGPERNITQFRRSTVIPNHTVRKHGKWLRIVSVKLSRPCHADAASTVGMIHKDQLSSVRVRIFQRREFPHFGAERFVISAGMARQ